MATFDQKNRLASVLNKLDKQRGLDPFVSQQLSYLLNEIPRSFDEKIKPYAARIASSEDRHTSLHELLNQELKSIASKSDALSRKHGRDIAALEASLSQLVNTASEKVSADLRAYYLDETSKNSKAVDKILKKLEKDVEQLFWMRTLNGSNNVQAVLNIKNNGSAIANNVTAINFTTNLTATSNADGSVSVSATGGGGGFTTLAPTETPNGSLQVFTFPSATAKPTFIISDNAMMQATTKSGTVNWTWNAGLKQATMTIAPQDDIVAIQ